MNRSGAFELSMQSISVFILAIIVLGLIISVIYGIFERMPPPDMPEVLEDIGVRPTADEPLLVENRQAELPRRGTDTIRFAVFNTLEDTQPAGSYWYFNARECVGFDDATVQIDVQSTRYQLARDLEYGDVVRFQTVARIEPGSSVVREEQYTCTGYVSTEHTGDERTADQNSAFAYGSFILTIT